MFSSSQLQRVMGGASVGFIAASIAHAGLGVSLGLLYTVTYYGRAALPLPYPVGLLAPFFYYVSMSSSMSSEAQAVWWIWGFLVAAAVWIVTLKATARLLRLPASLRDVVLSIAVSAVPLLLPAPWAGWVIAQTSEGASWKQFIAACLRREFAVAPAGLNPVYIIAALLALAIEITLLRRRAACKISRALLWLGVSLPVAAVLTTLLAMVAGTFVGAME
jgi:hypothetical protein